MYLFSNLDVIYIRVSQNMLSLNFCIKINYISQGRNEYLISEGRFFVVFVFKETRKIHNLPQWKLQTSLLLFLFMLQTLISYMS